MKKLFFFLLTVVTYNGVTAQNVGIGTSTPTDKLHVAGNIKADTIKPNGIKLTPNAGNGKILISDAAGAAGDDFGYSVFISDDYAIIGVRNGNGSNASGGTAYIYLRVGFGWQLLQKISDPASTSTNFGISVADEGNTKRFACGAPFYGSFSGKVLFGKIN